MRARKARADRMCQTRLCESKGYWDVFNTIGERVGTFCEKHADERVRAMNEYDRLVNEAYRRMSLEDSAS